jgi:hypothetical protein
MRKATSFLVALLAVLAIPILRAQAQTFTVLYSFTGGADGGNPFAGLVINKERYLYGTTVQGGDLACRAPVMGAEPCSNWTQPEEKLCFIASLTYLMGHFPYTQVQSGTGRATFTAPPNLAVLTAMERYSDFNYSPQNGNAWAGAMR